MDFWFPCAQRTYLRRSWQGNEGDFRGIDGRAFVAEIETVALGERVYHTRNFPQVLVVVIDGNEEFRAVAPYVLRRAAQRLLLEAFDVRLDEGHGLPYIGVEGDHVHLAHALFREGIGRRTRVAGRKSESALFVGHAFQAHIYALETRKSLFHQFEYLGGYFVAVYLFVAIRAVIDEVGHHAVAYIRAEVDHHFVARALDQIEVEILVEKILFRFRRGLEVVTVPVVEDGEQSFFGAEIGKSAVKPDEIAHMPAERAGFQLNLLVNARVGVKPAPEPEFVEKVGKTALRIAVHGGKCRLYVAADVLFRQTFDFLCQVEKLLVDNIHRTHSRKASALLYAA